jgi:hypothetical protein
MRETVDNKSLFSTIVYFPDSKTAVQFSNAIRRRGYRVHRQGHKVYTTLKPYEVSVILKDWSKNRGSLPWTNIVS